MSISKRISCVLIIFCIGNSLNAYVKKRIIKQLTLIIFQVDAATGEQETRRSVLSRSIRLARALEQFGLKTGDVVALTGLNHLDLTIPYNAGLMNGYPIAAVDPSFKFGNCIVFVIF